MRAISSFEQAQLERYGFDEPTFTYLQNRLRQGHYGQESNFAEGQISHLQKHDWQSFSEATAATLEQWRLLGQKAVQQEEVAVVILNGGMATRFGGQVKGVVEVCQGYSFLALKLLQLAQVAPKSPVFLMNSFATHDKTMAHLHTLLEKPTAKLHGLFKLSQIYPFLQTISLRLQTDASLYRDVDGHPSFYAPGHGDLFHTLAKEKAFESFVQKGGKYLLVSNVDNIAASMNPAILGAHIAHQQAITVEVVKRLANDPGGAPVLYNGRKQILESFRFPKTFNQQSLALFNSNTFMMDCRVIYEKHPLSWFRVDKKVNGQEVVQFERLIGEVTAFVDAAYLEVGRQAEQCRFLPVKTPDDLPTAAAFAQKYLLKNMPSA